MICRSTSNLSALRARTYTISSLCASSSLRLFYVAVSRIWHHRLELAKSRSCDSIFVPVTTDVHRKRPRTCANIVRQGFSVRLGGSLSYTGGRGSIKIMTRIQYPEARRDESVVDDYHSVEVRMHVIGCYLEKKKMST